MAITISNAFETQWSAEVKHDFQQNGSKLREAVRVVTGVKGSTFKFQTLGKVTANTKSVNAEVSLLEPVHGTVTATLSDRYAPMMVDSLDELKVTPDFRREFVQNGAAALGRSTDSLIIAAMDASNTDITTTTGALTYAKLLQAKKALDDSDVDLMDRYLVIGPRQLQDALNIAELKSQDYVALSTVTPGKIVHALGFNWILSTQLTVATNIRSCYAFNKQAVGLAIGQDVVTKIDYVPMRAGWLINSYMSMGAAVIEATGVVEIKCDET